MHHAVASFTDIFNREVDVQGRGRATLHVERITIESAMAATRKEPGIDHESARNRLRDRQGESKAGGDAPTPD